MNSQQRRLLLLVFLWTCLCLYLLRAHNKQINEPPPPAEPLPIFEYQLAPSSWPELADKSFAFEQLSSPIITSKIRPKSISEIEESSKKRDFGQLTSDNLQKKQIPLSSKFLGRKAALGPSDTSATSDLNVHTAKDDILINDRSSEASARQLHSISDQIEDQEEENVVGRENLINLWRQELLLRNNDEFKNASFNFAGAKCQYDYPSLLDLQFNNVYWQKMQSVQAADSKPDLKREHPNSPPQPANYYLYNAYFDDRWRAKGASVRILAMIDRNQPPDTNCLLWSRHLANAAKKSASGNKMVPLVTQAKFVYAWYPKWGNHHDGMLQPWIVTCPIPAEFKQFVPDSVSLVQVPDQLSSDHKKPSKRSAPNSNNSQQSDIYTDETLYPLVGSSSSSASPGSIAMPPGSSSSPTLASSSQSNSSPSSDDGGPSSGVQSNHANINSKAHNQYDCKQTLPITNNLPIFNIRPKKKQKFAVCVKGLDFPNEDLSIRLVEWIELLNLLGASKIFLYNLNVHENITRVLHYYKERGIVELVSLTLPGDQPNLPQYQHTYLKNRLTTKRQNELIPYNDCLYRNLYSYKYLALLDIDEIIMPLKHHTWFGLMDEVERVSLLEQNYSRASYNTRNVYFFDDLMGPLGTTSSSTTASANNVDGTNKVQQSADMKAPNSEDDGTQNVGLGGEQGIPHYLHMMQHVYRSKNYTKPGQYVKCFHNTERVVSLHNHFPMNCFGQCTTYSIPTSLAHLQHYRRDCVGPLKQACKNDFRLFTTRDTTIWKYKQQMIRRATRVLHELSLLDGVSTERRRPPLIQLS